MPSYQLPNTLRIPLSSQTIVRSEIQGSFSAGGGGAVFSLGNVVANASAFRENYAAGSSGAVSVALDLSAEGTLFENNGAGAGARG